MKHLDHLNKADMPPKPWYERIPWWLRKTISVPADKYAKNYNQRMLTCTVCGEYKQVKGGTWQAPRPAGPNGIQ